MREEMGPRAGKVAEKVKNRKNKKGKKFKGEKNFVKRRFGWRSAPTVPEVVVRFRRLERLLGIDPLAPVLRVVHDRLPGPRVAGI